MILSSSLAFLFFFSTYFTKFVTSMVLLVYIFINSWIIGLEIIVIVVIVMTVLLVINFVGKLPTFLKSIIWGTIKFLDRHDLLPSSLTNDTIYYSTILVSNLGSIDCDAIYHHLTDFGTNSILITIGKIKKEVVIIDGKEQIRDIVEFGAAVDERIGDGYYFVKSMKLLQKIFDSPELLEEDANEKIEETNK